MEEEDGFEIVPIVAIESPCINVCRMGADRLCEGCRRTLAEIAGWSAGTPEWRADVLAALADR